MKINANRNKNLRLGRTGENLVTEVIFDIGDWQRKLGEGTVVLVNIRPEDTEPYPVSVTIDEDKVIWTVTSTDTAQAGTGKCELQYIVDEAVAKSKIWETTIVASLDDVGETPDPESGWVADLLNTIGDMVEGSTGETYEIATDEETAEMLEEIFS